ncbi:PLP-dependent cysteine synthase family protein [Microbacterium sp. UFMG61]|uniref:PLP-dependent cysteine synthase family protein n=1 Tax=Microbacterium sp. UFMG61 TaxID=2745935 RepID=UPI001E2B6F8C|nr:PLP-dependent cysteine synthase family protein [Microbacterium sp. UFMG61]
MMYSESPITDASDVIRPRRTDRRWVTHALELLTAEAGRSGWTPLIPFHAPGLREIDIYLKDESLHPTGSLKHRLARSLFTHGLCNGDIGPQTTIVEASSGSTAVSEAYFAQILGLDFIAVIPAATSREKIALIERHGGQVLMVEASADVVRTAQKVTVQRGGHFMDQFTFASQATNWREGNIASELFHQMRREKHPVPEWIVVGAGTGGTSTSIARYARFTGLATRIAVVDPEGSAFYEGWRRNDISYVTSTPSRIEGIGRTRVERSFVPNLIDEVLPVPDAASIATMRWASRIIGRRVGASTGTNIWGTLQLVQRLGTSRRTGSIVSLICDTGDRYSSTYYNDEWLAAQNIDIAPFERTLEDFTSTGVLRAA